MYNNIITSLSDEIIISTDVCAKSSPTIVNSPVLELLNVLKYIIYVFGVLGGSRSCIVAVRYSDRRRPLENEEEERPFICVLYYYHHYIYSRKLSAKDEIFREIITSSHTTIIIIMIIMIFHPDSRISDFARNLRQKYVYVIIIIERILIHGRPPRCTSREWRSVPT